MAKKRPYRYVVEMYGRVRVLPVPASGLKAVKFHADARKIARELFEVGYSLNYISAGGAGEMIFQHPDREVNKARAELVVKTMKERGLIEMPTKRRKKLTG